MVKSGDRDQAGFTTTLTDRPWVTIKYKSNTKLLDQELKGDGYFPYAAMLNGSTGKVIDAGARNQIRADPKGSI